MLHSPNFHPCSTWQKDIQEPLRYLKAQYEIQSDPECLAITNVTVDPFYTGRDIKRAAQAIIYFFEPLVILIPDELKPDPVKRTNRHDSFSSAETKKAQSQSIVTMEAIGTIETSHFDLLDSTALELILDFFQQANAEYCFWCFEKLLCNPAISFSPGSETHSTVQDAFRWVSVRLAFIQGFLAYTSLSHLQRIPQTCEGLREFMSGRPPPAGTTLRGRYNVRGVRVG